MGQTNQKIHLKLKQIGFQNLPSGFVLGEDKIFRSQSSPFALKGLSVLLNPKQVDAYLSHLPFRRQNLEFVQVLYVDTKHEQVDYCKLIIYIENLPLRLSQTYCLSFNNMIKILYRSLLGFKVLFQRFGYFTIDASLIAINEQGLSKCWMNQKFSNSIPKPSFSYNKVKNGEASMISQLKEIFRCQVDRSTIPTNFTLKSMSFETLIQELSTAFGEQFLNSRLDLTATNPSSPQKSHLSTVPSSTRSILFKTSSTTQIRFNYQMKQSTQSNIKATFNNNSIAQPKMNSYFANLPHVQKDQHKSVEPARGASTPIQKNEKAKICFTYQPKVTSFQQNLERSLIYDLQNSDLDVKRDEIVYDRNIAVIINQK